MDRRPLISTPGKHRRRGIEGPANIGRSATRPAESEHLERRGPGLNSKDLVVISKIPATRVRALLVRVETAVGIEEVSGFQITRGRWKLDRIEGVGVPHCEVAIAPEGGRTRGGVGYIPIDAKQFTVPADHAWIGSILQGRTPIIRQMGPELARDQTDDPQIRQRDPQGVAPQEGLEQRAGFRPHQVGPVEIAIRPKIRPATEQGLLLRGQHSAEIVVGVEVGPLVGAIQVANSQPSAKLKAVRSETDSITQAVVTLSLPAIDPRIGVAIGARKIRPPLIPPVAPDIRGPKRVFPATSLGPAGLAVDEIGIAEVHVEAYRGHEQAPGQQGPFAQDLVRCGDSQERAKARTSREKT